MRLAGCLPALGLLAAPAVAQEAARPLNRLDEIAPAFRGCWTPPPALGGGKGADVTVRLSLRMDGSLIGEPRVTAAGGLPEGPARTLLVASALRAVRNCTPLSITAGLGRAVAGRVFTLRFLHTGAVEQGVSHRV